MPGSDRSRSISYDQARGVILVLGLAVLGVLALIMYVRRVDPVEVTAMLFFLPVYVGFVFWGIPGGALVGVLATVGYIWMRSPAISVLGWGDLSGLIAGRAAGYLAFGLIGGWATEQLRTSIVKLDAYDEIDDESGLFNARSLVETVGLERSRAQRYGGPFSVVTATIPPTTTSGMARRKRREVLTSIGKRLQQSVRNVDHVVHAVGDGGIDLFAFILPETGVDGARSFAGKLGSELTATLQDHTLSTEVEVEMASHPEPALDGIVEQFRQIAARDFPEST